MSLEQSTNYFIVGLLLGGLVVGGAISGLSTEQKDFEVVYTHLGIVNEQIATETADIIDLNIKIINLQKQIEALKPRQLIVKPVVHEHEHKLYRGRQCPSSSTR